MDKKTMDDVKSFARENWENVIRDIGRLVAVNSVRTEARPGMPFGPGPAKALELGLEIAAELGLDAVNCENMIGYAQVGRGEDCLATITHLDVVPSAGWKEDPFTIRRKEGFIIGRGVLDDKGPSVLCLYALKYLKDRGIELRYPVRALLGADEESKMQDLEYYLAKYPAPLFCFSPDANFPLCNGEKGIFHARVISTLPLDKVADIRGGVAPNVIPGSAQAWLRHEGELESTQEVCAEKEGELWHLTAKGLGGHACHPEQANNAIALLVDYILDKDLLRGQEKEFFLGLRRLHCDYYGKGIGAQARDDMFEPLTIIGGEIGLKDGHIFQSVDSRYPTTSSGDKLMALLEKNWEGLARVVKTGDSVPFYMSLDNPAIQACIQAYNAVTGEGAKPYTIGGGTYARHFPNAVSFGPEHPERPAPDFAGPIHGVDEAACEDWMREALEIYILALLELEKLDY